MVNSIIWAIVCGAISAMCLIAVLDQLIHWYFTGKLNRYILIMALFATVQGALASSFFAQDIRDYIKEPVVITTVPPEVMFIGKDSLTVTYQFHENLYK